MGRENIEDAVDPELIFRHALNREPRPLQFEDLIPAPRDPDPPPLLLRPFMFLPRFGIVHLSPSLSPGGFPSAQYSARMIGSKISKSPFDL